jgi:hypothetical protein
VNSDWQMFREGDGIGNWGAFVCKRGSFLCNIQGFGLIFECICIYGLAFVKTGLGQTMSL